MNANHLLAQYERIADAPDAIGRLRRFVLDLAVRGKLVPQDPKDEPASVLLKRLLNQEAKDSCARKKQAEATAIEKTDRPFAAPEGWLWLRFGSIHELVRGVTYTQSDVAETHVAGHLPILRANNIGTSLNFDELVFVRKECVSPDQMLRRGDYLIALSSGSKNLVGKAAFVAADYDAGFGGFCGVIRLLSPSLEQFVGVFLSSRLYREAISAGSRGIGINNLKRETLNDILFPFPSLAEQHRIVAKVNELMTLCDRLEETRATREATRDRLATSSLARLDAPDSITFQDDARFALDALPALTTRPDQVRQLRQTILNLAVRGKLVPQDPNDEPASALLKGIEGERIDLVKRRLIRREEPLDPIQPSEQPFGVPNKWLWSRIGNAVLFAQYGTSQKSHPAENGVPVLTMGNIQDGRVIWNNEKKIPATSTDLPGLFLSRFDILYNRTNSAELVGKTGIYLGGDGVRTFASYLIRLRPSLAWSDPRYLNMAMNAPAFRATQIIPLIKKQTGQANVNGTALKNMLIPLPPLAEQRRIVAKVDELMGVCDRLEKSLATGENTRRDLLDALLAEALTAANRDAT